MEPKNGINLGAYARFLTDIRKDYNQAGQFYQKAIAVDPLNVVYQGNYAKVLIVQGNLEKAKIIISKAFDINQKIKDLELELELWFYCYAVFYQEFPNCEAAIEALLAQGVRSTGWDLKDVLEAAKKKGHPDFEKLSQYESRIAGAAS